MDTFIEYQRFPDYEAASELIDILEENEIPYQVNDSAIRFDIAASSISPFDKQVIIQIRENDFERVSTLFKTLTDESQNNSAEDHYLYSFSDTDIIDVIANPSEWNEHEVGLAKQISNSRGLKPTAELIKTIRKEKLKEQQQKETETKNIKKFGYGWFLWIGYHNLCCCQRLVECWLSSFCPYRNHLWFYHSARESENQNDCLTNRTLKETKHHEEITDVPLACYIDRM